MNPKRSLALILLAVAAQSGTASASGSGDVVLIDTVSAAFPETPGEHYAAFQSGCTSLSEAVERVRRQYGGRIISAETIRSGNREVHVIKVLTRDNKVKTVRVNGCRLDNRRG